MENTMLQHLQLIKPKKSLQNLLLFAKIAKKKNKKHDTTKT